MSRISRMMHRLGGNNRRHREGESARTDNAFNIRDIRVIRVIRGSYPLFGINPSPGVTALQLP